MLKHLKLLHDSSACHRTRLRQQVQVVVGLVVRDHIMVLLRQALGRGSARVVDASWEELNRRYVSTEGQRLVSEQQLAVLQVHSSASALVLIS